MTITTQDLINAFKFGANVHREGLLKDVSIHDVAAEYINQYLKSKENEKTNTIELTNYSYTTPSWAIAESSMFR